MQNFRGIITPIATCFHNTIPNTINETEQQKLLTYLLDTQQVDGIAACASTSEGVLLTDAEYWKSAEICLAECKKRNKLAILATTHFNPEVSIVRNHQAKELGYDAVMLTPPPYSNLNQTGIKKFYQEIANQAQGLPIIMYSIPNRTGGKPMEANTIIELSQYDGIIGIKDCGVNTPHCDEVLEKIDHKNFVYYCGDDLLYFDFLMHGADSAISGSSHIVGKTMKEMLISKQQGNIDLCLMQYRSIKNIIAALFAEPSPSGIKAALSYLGVCESLPKYPQLLESTEVAKENIYQLLEA